MLQIQEVEEGLIDVAQLVDDNELRKQVKHKPKQGLLENVLGISDPLKFNEASLIAEANDEVKSVPVKVKIVKVQNALDEVRPPKAVNLVKREAQG